MNYYYDVVLNFDSEHIWKFYEWEKDDYFTIVKKIPLFRVSFETICDFLNYEVQVDSDFCEQVAHQTVYKGNLDEFYASFLLSDSKNSIAVAINSNGFVEAISYLSILESNHLNEYMYTLTSSVIGYKKLNKRGVNHKNRQMEKMKNFVLVELNTLYDEKNVFKMKYLYYEWFLEEEEDISKMYQKMKKNLSTISLSMLQHLDYLIRLSYHQV